MNSVTNENTNYQNNATPSPSSVDPVNDKIEIIVKKYLENEITLSELEKTIVKNKDDVPVEDSYITTVQESLNDALKALGRLRPWDQKNSFILFFERLVEKVIFIIDSAVEACGLRGFFDKDYSKGSDVQKALTVLSFVTAISAFFLRLGQLVFLATVSAGLVTLFVLLSLIWPYINPIPRKVEGCQNITVETRSSTLIISSQRQKILDELAEKLSPQTPLLLQGKSNVGKTTLIHALAQQIERGKHPSLKGKRFFYLSADALKGGEFNKITTQIQRHSKDIVLVVDNLHLISRRKTTGMTELQKFILDNQASGKCSVIAIENETTDKTTENLSTYTSMKGKFSHTMTLDKMKVEEQEELLCETFFQKREKVLITREQIKELVDQKDPLTALHQKIGELKAAERKDLFVNPKNYKRTLQVARRIDQLTVQIAKSKKPQTPLLAKHYVFSKIMEELVKTDPSKLKPTDFPDLT